MLIVPMLSVIEEAVSDGGVDNLSGNVSDMDRMLSRDALAALERAHDGYFAFLAFQPSVDAPVLGYLVEGSLPADSGARALVLFTLAESATAQWMYADVALDALAIEGQADLPAQTALGLLFGDKVPPLPGLAVFGSFCSEDDAVYFYLDRAGTPADIRSQLRGILALADTAWQDCGGRRDRLADALALSAQRRKVRFARTGRRSMLQWLDLVVHWLDRHSGDIVAVAGLVA